MNAEMKELDLSKWFSTYGVLTAERIFERFKIFLDQQEIITAVKNPRSIYYQLLRVPLKNILNGIILQQAHDYQSYAQKLFIDYFLSGQNEKPEDAPGASIRESLEQQRQLLINTDDAFESLNQTHKELIAQSQKELIDLANDLQISLG